MPLIEVKAAAPVIREGTYDATLISIRPKRMVSQFTDPPGQEVDNLEWSWLVDGPDAEVEITSLSSLATTPKSKIYEYLLALVGADKAAIGAGFEESDLVGKLVQVVIVTSDKGYSKIESVVPPKIVGAKAKAAAAAGSAPAAAAPTRTKPPTEDDDLPF
jgi:hypothetical protein